MRLTVFVALLITAYVIAAVVAIFGHGTAQFIARCGCAVLVFASLLLAAYYGGWTRKHVK